MIGRGEYRFSAITARAESENTRLSCGCACYRGSKMIAQSDGAFGLAGAGLLMGIAVVIISIVWLAFPFIVTSKFNSLLKVSREVLAELRKAQTALPPPVPSMAPSPPLPAKTPPPPPLPLAEPATGKHYYMNRSGEVAGPITAAELSQLRTAGEINNDTLVQAEFSGDWQPLRSMATLPN